MGYILSADALVQVLRAQAEERVVRWLEKEKISPFVDWFTMAVASAEIRDSELDDDAKDELKKSYAAMVRKLNAKNPIGVSLANMNSGAAERLSRLMVIAARHTTDLSDADLVPAAIAMEHGLTLVVARNKRQWENLMSAIDEKLGMPKLHLQSP